MLKNSTPTAAVQPLVSFSFAFPAHLAALFAQVVKADGLTPQQAAAIAATSWLRGECDEHHLPGFDDREELALAVAANAAGAEAEHVNVTLLADDLAYIVEQAEELIHSHTMHTDELTGLALAEHVDALTVEPDDDLETARLHAAYLRRLLAAKGVCK